MMKKSLFLFLILLATTVMAQQGKKPPAKEKPPTQKEMADMMKEMQGALDSMSPEDKRMMDSMGVKMPDMKGIQKTMSGVTDAKIKKTVEDESRIVPKRDESRIAAIPGAVTDSKMSDYINGVQSKVAAVLKPAVTSKGNEVYAYIKSTSKNAGESGTMAIGLWLAGQPQVALYVLGKISASDATNTDNLSNYAAMLTMYGAQHLAIPVLNNLNAKFPKNSTLLNNLGQAWFGLGEMGKAEKYLDSAIRIYAFHPQANLTKSFIEESKGNKQQAIEAVKRSIAKAYSMEKENRLNKLGQDLNPKILAWDRPMPQDPLGLEKFKWPSYPQNVNESKTLEAEWDEFKKKCNEAKEELSILEKSLSQQAEQANDARTRQLMQAGQNGTIVDPWPPMAYKAMAKLKYLIDDKDGHLAFSFQKKQQAVLNAGMEVEKFDEIYDNQVNVLSEKYKTEFGEGKSNPFDAACADDTKVKNAFLSSSNTPLQEAYNDFLAFMRRKINDETYYNQYTMWPENFELAKVQAKIKWLGYISSQNPQFLDKGIWCPNNTDTEVKNFKLPNFDDLNCQYKSSLNLGCLKMETNCGQTTTTYGCGQIKFIEKELGQNYIGGTLMLSHKSVVPISSGPLWVSGSIGGDFSIEFDKNNNVKDWEGKVTMGVQAGVGTNIGPVKAGASVSEALEIEIGSTGISDINIVTAAQIKAGIAAPKSAGTDKIDQQINKGVDYVNKGISKLNTNVEIGIQSRTSLISGHVSESGTGILSGIKMGER